MTEEKVSRRKTAEDKAEQPVVEVVAAPKVRAAKRISFEQWATARNIRPQHMRGMKAHVANVARVRTAEEWDAAFANY